MYTDKNGHRHYDLDEKPWWWLNLEKAWAYNRSKNPKPKKQEMPLIPKGMLYNSDEYVNWTLQQDYGSQGMSKRKPGRPKLRPEQRKKPKLKRSEQMKELLQVHGITVLEDLTLKGYDGLKFLPNGRVGGKGLNISVHQFLQNIDGK